MRLWVTQHSCHRVRAPIPGHTVLAETESAVRSLPSHFTDLPRVIEVVIGNGKA